MTVAQAINVSHGCLLVHGRTIFTCVPDNIKLTPRSDVCPADGAFIGAVAASSRSFHVLPIGKLQGLRFLCLFRFKIWWMTQRMGTLGRDVPLETQFMLLESSAGYGETIYILLLPLLEGQFRAVLQGNENDELEVCLDSGDNTVETNHGSSLLYIHSGSNPFDVINQAIKAVEKHTNTFLHREKKQMPSFLDWFGWCTWDAFYTDVSAHGVEQGLKSFAQGGALPRFLIIDDGWQKIASDVYEGSQFTSRLTGIKENSKFNKNHGCGSQANEQVQGLKLVVEDAKKLYNLKYVYVWHALAGYWGGVSPSASGMEDYETTMVYPVQFPGAMGNEPDMGIDILSKHGLGLIHPNKAFSFYSNLHSYLASCGVDGVKVDVQNIMETIGAGHRGRVALARAYHQALEASIAENFPDNGCISCMCHNTDGLYSAKQTAVVRASDDFYPWDPASHTIHISSVTYNSLFLGEFMQPDWDMFQSLHPAAEFHAAARAIGGCPVYVSDKPNNHNFDLLKKLVLPDGSVLRAQLPGRPTLDCLFNDPARDGTSLLKIWNVNKCTGVVGVFNCQGAGWCKVAKKTLVHDSAPGILTGSICAHNVDSIQHLAGPTWNGQVVLYAFKSGDINRLLVGTSLSITLKVLEYELFCVSPIKRITSEISFAPIGLLDMFNSGGAIERFDVLHIAGNTNETPNFHKETRVPVAMAALKVRGCGRFGAYSSHRPANCTLGSTDIEFIYDSAIGLVTTNIPIPEQEMYIWALEFQF